MRRLAWVLFMCGGLGVGLGASTEVARACGGGSYGDYEAPPPPPPRPVPVLVAYSRSEAPEPRVSDLRRAQQLMARGRAREAAKAVTESFGNLMNERGGDPWRDQARIVLARAVARVGSDSELEWALPVLENAAQESTDPRILTALGEAKSKVPGQIEQAREILEQLARGDLLTSAEGYRALAVLRRARGDHAGAGDAVARCSRMAPEAQLCGVPRRIDLLPRERRNGRAAHDVGEMAGTSRSDAPNG